MVLSTDAHIVNKFNSEMDPAIIQCIANIVEKKLLKEVQNQLLWQGLKIYKYD